MPLQARPLTPTWNQMSVSDLPQYWLPQGVTPLVYGPMPSGVLPVEAMPAATQPAAASPSTGDKKMAGAATNTDATKSTSNKAVPANMPANTAAQSQVSFETKDAAVHSEHTATGAHLAKDVGE